MVLYSHVRFTLHVPTIAQDPIEKSFFEPVSQSGALCNTDASFPYCSTLFVPFILFILPLCSSEYNLSSTTSSE